MVNELEANKEGMVPVIFVRVCNWNLSHDSNEVLGRYPSFASALNYTSGQEVVTHTICGDCQKIYYKEQGWEDV